LPGEPGHHYILKCSKAWQEVRILEYNPYEMGAKGSQLPFSQTIQSLAERGDFSICWPVKTSDEIEKGGLAGTRGADNGDYLAALHLERDVVKCIHRVFPSLVDA
jgi:hypothetical protein